MTGQVPIAYENLASDSPRPEALAAQAPLLLIGKGRLAIHLKHWLKDTFLLFQWTRGEDLELLNDHLAKNPRVLLAISDNALEDFYQNRLAQAVDRGCPTPVHFSGAFHHPKIISAHPLMSFGTEIYSECGDFYSQIHWVLSGVSSLQEIFPGVSNSFSILDPREKPLYHAACVLGGNLPILLWQEMASIHSRLKLSSPIPVQAQNIYLKRIFENYLSHSASALTGPLARRDLSTISANLKALDSNPFREVYQAFVSAYFERSPINVPQKPSEQKQNKEM